MRLCNLYLDSFGHFREASIDLPDAPAVVFLGPNEAGKSTLLAFIRGVLFGFPTQYTAQHYPSLGRGEGGRIVVSDQSGMRYTVERRTGASAGPWVTSSSGPVADAQPVLTRLTGGTSLDAFKNIYAFTLDELQSIAQLRDFDIYSAAQGAPGLSELLRSLGRKKEDIYRPRGNLQEVPRLVNALREVDGQLQRIQDNARFYGELTSRRTEVEEKLSQAVQELEVLVNRRSEIGRLLNGWEDWIALSDCESRLRDVPKYADFPENPILRLDAIEMQIRQLREDREEIARQLQDAESGESSPIPNEGTLEDRANIDAVLRGRDRYDSAVKDLPDRRLDVVARESEFKGLLGDLGENWDEERLESFATSIAFRQEVEQSKEQLEERQEAVSKGEQRLEQEQRLLEGCNSALTEAQERLPSAAPSLDAATLRQQRAALLTTRSRLGEYERARMNHENVRFQAQSTGADTAPTGISASPLWIVAGLLGLCGVLLAAFGAALASMTLLTAGGIVLVVALLAIATYLVLSRRVTRPTYVNTLAARAEEAREQAEAARNLLLEASSSMNVPGDPTAEALDVVDQRLIEAQMELTTWHDASERVRDAQRHFKSQQGRVETAGSGLQAARDSFAEALQRWREWLEQREIPRNFTPDTVIEFVGKVETARVKLDQVNGERRRADAVQRIIDGYRGQVAPLAQRHGVALDPGDQRQLGTAADELIRRLNEAQAASSDRERTREQAENLRQQLEGRERRLEQAAGELAALLEAGGTDDAEEFRRRARQNDERLEIERLQSEHRRNLERLSGPGERFLAFCGELAEADPDALREEAANLDQQQSELQESRSGLNQELGEIRSELGRLTSEEESSSLRIRRNTLAEQLQEHASEWARLTIAEELLNRTRRKFEQERQPDVIRHAQEFFSSVTGQRYQQLYAPIGEQSITVIDSDASGKKPTELSRGTREQLYLALRFGLIRGSDEHSERLPVVVDEALVNFDPERACLAATAFGKLSETNQVLVFTCQPATADMFAEHAGAQVVDIGR